MKSTSWIWIQDLELEILGQNNQLLVVNYFAFVTMSVKPPRKAVSKSCGKQKY